MKVFIKKSQLKGEVDIIASKSYAHRILICSAFCSEQTKIYNLPNSQDILATMSCLESLGVNFIKKKEYVIVIPTTLREQNAELNVGESGSTLRFFLPIVSALGGAYKLVGSKKLISRPSLDLLNCLKENGMDYVVDQECIFIKGKLNNFTFNINAKYSSQFLTGLMLASPLINKECKIFCENLSSSDYIEITKDVLSRFNINVENSNGIYTVFGEYNSPKEIIVEGDYSNALFFAIGGIICGEVLIKGLNPNSKQGDKKAFDILKQAGANISILDNGILFKKSNLISVKFNGDNIPDAIPALSLVLSLAKGISEIDSVDRLRLKESDRIASILSYMKIAGGTVEYKNSKLIIKNSTLNGGKFDSFNDHRMVMTIAILGCMLGDVEIENAQAVNKSYPEFFTELQRVGGQLWIE